MERKSAVFILLLVIFFATQFVKEWCSKVRQECASPQVTIIMGLVGVTTTVPWFAALREEASPVATVWALGVAASALKTAR
ncbi:Arrestin domain-containing protein 2 [Bienertia sinuspersici]